MAQEKKERIFISYKRVDKERVFAIKDGIEQATGEKCWIDLEGIESNAQFAAKIMTAIDRCDVFLFMRSKEHNKIVDLETDWTYRELNYALAKGKNIVFVNLDNSPMPDWVTFIFPHKQEVDSTDQEKIDRLQSDLIEWLGINTTNKTENKFPVFFSEYEGPAPTPASAHAPEPIEKTLENVLASVSDKPFIVGDFFFQKDCQYLGLSIYRGINDAAESLSIPEKIIYSGIDIPITSVGEKAFENFSCLTSVSIPDSIKVINSDAFRNCVSLSSIIIPKGVKDIAYDAFRGCSSLNLLQVAEGNHVYDSRCNCNGLIHTSSNVLVVGCKNTLIPKSVLGVGPYAFYGCSELLTISIPSTVRKIGDSAFNNCRKLAELNIPTKIDGIGEYAFAGCESLVNVNITTDGDSYFDLLSIDCWYLKNVNGIGDHAFEGCTSLTKIEIPHNIDRIGYRAFMDCKSLISVCLPLFFDKNIRIEEEAFANCSSLRNFSRWENSSSIGNYFGCSNFRRSYSNNPETTMDLTIGKRAFANCDSLTHVYIPGCVTIIEEEAFCNCSSLMSVDIFDYVECISDGAFKNCSSLTDVFIPQNVSNIGDNAFRNCSALVNLCISDNVKMIGDGALSNCSNLVTVNIPIGVNYIGERCFDSKVLESVLVDEKNAVYDSRNNCNAIIQTAINTLVVGCKNTNIPDGIVSIGRYAFYECTSLSEIVIPSSVRFIEYESFKNCHSLVSITYVGTMEQWNTIDKGEQWNDNIPALVVHCTDGDVEI